MIYPKSICLIQRILWIIEPIFLKAEKLANFEIAVEAFKTLDYEANGSLSETVEREELCALFNELALKAGIDPCQYGDGEGPASEWRDW